VRKDGEPIRVHKHVTVLPGYEGGSGYLLALVSDITEQARIQRALERSESRYRELVQNANSAIVRWRRDGTLTFVNEHAETLFGYEASELIGQNVNILLPKTESTGRDLSGLIEDISAHPERYRQNVNENICRDGRRLWMVWANRAVRDERGRVVEVLAVGSDVTELKAAEAALKEADRRKDEFLAILSHELRNPLAPLRTGLDLLQRAGDDPITSSRVRAMMSRQLDHLVRLVDDLLDVSRITRGKINLRREQVDLREAVSAAIEAAGPGNGAGQRRLVVNLPDEPVLVEGDPVRLAQVIGNLLGNAVKFTREGGQIWLSLASHQDEVRISVRDDGVGIPRERIGGIFDMFSQAHSTRGGGLGIGLALVRRLVELHGGKVEARSEGPEKGSELIVTLPLAEHIQTSPSRAPEHSADGIAGRHILVVDDNRDIANGMGTLLRLLGAKVRVAYDGAAALAQLDGDPPEVILLDIGMPGMDGYEVARRIRAHPQGSKLLLVAVTGWGDDQDRQRVLSAGFDHHLVKPASVDGLRAVLAG
jgi:PAS domain S-box-containing protein